MAAEDPKLSDIPTTLADETFEHRIGTDYLNDPIVSRLRIAHANARASWISTLKTHRAVMADPMHTPMRNLQRSAQHADRKQAEACRHLDEAKARADEELALMDETIRRSLSEHAAAYGAEIRNHIKTMSADARVTFLTNRMKSGDFGAIGAALAAPPYLSGMGDGEHAMLYETYQQHRFPQAVARRQAIEKALDITMRGGVSLIESMSKLIDRKALEQAEALQRAAQQAAE